MLRLTRQQVRDIDRISIEEFHVPGIVLMENAARNLADVACQMLNDDCLGEVVIVCGGGNNGGDGLALARHLHNRGADVSILLTADPAKYKGEAKINFDIVQAMKLPITGADPPTIEVRRPLLLVDAIFGTGLIKPPRDPFASLVRAIQETGAPVLSVDIPSGLDADTGIPLGPAAVHARRTVTFVAEKTGFASPHAAEYLGEVIVAEIGCPAEAIECVTRGAAERLTACRIISSPR